ncbi:MAG TPA: adenylate/guanylate cyclase domain-containing protein [Actinomycetota bacterium]
MPIICPSCGGENPDQARFCLACGSPVAARVEVRRERKFVAMLFADLVGSTSLGEREDPEVVQDVVSSAFTRLGTEVERFGGTIDKIMGDAILALFGVPAAHEDDPERAVRAALEMQSVLAALNAEAGATGRPQLGMRVGIEAGEVMVNLERTIDLPDRMVTGDAANTASRLQSAAEPGSVVVGPAVYAASNQVIDYRELAPVHLKGKVKAMPVWVAAGVKTRHGERARFGLEASLVGRDDELASLKQAFHRVVSSRRPALVTVVGPAGVGKSRIAWELSKYVDGLPEPPTWMRGRCYAYGNRSYSAFAEAMKARCGVREDETPEAIRSGIHAVVGALFDDGTVASEVEALVGGTAERGFLREELFEAWRRFLERDAAGRPVVLLLEDIHWADEGLLDFLDHLAVWGQGPILVLTLARPELFEHRPDWGGGKRSYTALYLDPLSEDQNAEMLTRLLGSQAPEGLRQLVLERSEGNPLFTEEIVRSLIDRGILRTQHADSWELAAAIEDIELPRSVQGVIASRLDALPADEKRVLQDGAVVGRVFWLGALAALGAGDPAGLRDATGRLRLKEILIPREPSAFAGDPELGFRHVLIRDVAYESLPKSERAAKHAHVAEWFEQVAGERAQEFAEQIATHHAERRRHLAEVGAAAPDVEAADRDLLRWSLAAADRARRLREASEAVRWFAAAVDAARSLGGPPGELAGLLEDLGWTEMGAGRVADGTAHLREALELREREGSELDAGRLQGLLGTIAFQNGRREEAMVLMASAFSRLQPLGDSAELAFATTFMTIGILFAERLEEAEPLFRQALAMAEAAARDPEAGYIAYHALSLVQLFLVMCLIYLGRWREAEPMVEEIESLARSSGDVGVYFRAMGMQVLYLHDGAPDLDLARIDRLLDEQLDLARKSGRFGDAIYTIDAACWVNLIHGRLDAAEALGREAVEWSSHGADAFASEALRRLGWTALVRGDVDGAERLMDEAGDIQASNLGGLSPPIVRAGIARARGDREQAAEILTERAKAAPAGAPLDQWERVFIEAAVVLTELGRMDEAREMAGRLRRLADIRVQLEPLALWGEGLAAGDDEIAAESLAEAAAGFEVREQPVDVGRCLIALAAVQSRLGGDAGPTLHRARETLAACGAGLYLAEAEAAGAV